MKIEKTVFFHKKIVITEKRLIELNSIISKYCEELSYSAKLKDKTSIKFDSFDELCSYENFNNRKIKTLEIRGHTFLSNTIVVEIAPSYRLESETASCKYELYDSNQEAVFDKEIRDFFEKAVSYQKSYSVCEWGSFALMICIAILFFMRLLPNTAEDQITYTFFAVFIGALVVYKLFSHFILGSIFPDAIFAWGEEEEQYHKLEKIRSNFFWCVIVAAIVAIVVNRYF